MNDDYTPTHLFEPQHYAPDLTIWQATAPLRERAAGAGVTIALAASLAPAAAMASQPDISWSPWTVDITGSPAGGERADETPAPEETAPTVDESASAPAAESPSEPTTDTGTTPDPVSLPEQAGDAGVSYVAQQTTTGESVAAANAAAVAAAGQASDPTTPADGAPVETAEAPSAPAAPVITAWDQATGTLVGTAPAGATVVATAADGTQLAQATAGEDGAFTLALPAGSDLATVTLTAYDAAGVASPATSGADYLRGLDTARRASVAAEVVPAVASFAEDLDAGLGATSLYASYDNVSTALPISTYAYGAAAAVLGVATVVGGSAAIRRAARRRDEAAAKASAPSPVAAVVPAADLDDEVVTPDAAPAAPASAAARVAAPAPAAPTPAAAADSTAAFLAALGMSLDEIDAVTAAPSASDTIAAPEGHATPARVADVPVTPASVAPKPVVPASAPAAAADLTAALLAAQPASDDIDWDALIGEVLEEKRADDRRAAAYVPAHAAAPFGASDDLESMAQRYVGDGKPDALATSAFDISSYLNVPAAPAVASAAPAAAPAASAPVSPATDSTAAFVAAARPEHPQAFTTSQFIALLPSDLQAQVADALGAAAAAGARLSATRVSGGVSSPAPAPADLSGLDRIDEATVVDAADQSGSLAFGGITPAVDVTAPAAAVVAPSEDADSSSTLPRPRPARPGTEGSVYVAPVIGPTPTPVVVRAPRVASAADVPVVDAEVEARADRARHAAAPAPSPEEVRRQTLAAQASSMDLDEPTSQGPLGFWARLRRGEHAGAHGATTDEAGVPTITRGRTAMRDERSVSLVVPEIPEVDPLSTLAETGGGSFASGLSQVVSSTVYVSGAAASTLQPDVAHAMGGGSTAPRRVPSLTGDISPIEVPPARHRAPAAGGRSRRPGPVMARDDEASQVRRTWTPTPAPRPVAMAQRPADAYSAYAATAAAASAPVVPGSRAYYDRMTSPAFIDYLVHDEFAHRHESASQRAAATGRLQVIDGTGPIARHASDDGYAALHYEA